jgi:hypothetical protein
MTQRWWDKLVESPDDPDEDLGPPTPSWFNDLLEQMSEHIETMPPMIGWQTWLPNEDDGWCAIIYPGPTEYEGKTIYPDAVVDVTAILALFSSFDMVTWDSSFDGVSRDRDGLIIHGAKDGNDVTVTVLRKAPVEVAAMTRILPGDNFAWEDIDPK